MKRVNPANVIELALKCKSKKELYDVMLHDWDFYLPPIQYANAAYMWGVISGSILVSKQYVFLLIIARKQKCCKNHSSFSN